LSLQEKVVYSASDATARRPPGASSRAAKRVQHKRVPVLVPVPRGKRAPAGGFALAIEINDMPQLFGSDFSFGVGRSIRKHEWFGLSEHSCGLFQNNDPGRESDRCTDAVEFGRREDNPDGSWSGARRLRAEIHEGCRLALQLSARDADGNRRAHFFVNREEVAVFGGILDSPGEEGDWVAGMTLPPCARVTIVHPHADELTISNVHAAPIANKLSLKKAVRRITSVVHLNQIVHIGDDDEPAGPSSGANAARPAASSLRTPSLRNAGKKIAMVGLLPICFS